VGAINRIPKAFLSFLGVKSLGVNPPFAFETVQPTLDHYRWIAAGLDHDVSVFNGTLIPNAANGRFDMNVQVPAGKAWIIYGVCTRVILNTATDRIIWRTALDQPLGIPAYVSPFETDTGIGAAGQEAWNVLPMPDDGLLLPSGFTFSMRLTRVSVVAGPSIAPTIQIWRAELDV